MTRRRLAWFGAAALAAIFITAGQWLLFSTFMLYDDEGYVLISLRNFARYGALYDQVYSQYGPFYYLALDAVHRLLGFDWTNTAGRWLTLINWTVTAGICGMLVGRRVCSVTAGSVTAAAVFTSLWIMIHEPAHPGGLIAMLVAAAAWVGIERDPATNLRGALAIGAIGAALALTKINVGGFLLISASTWLTFHAADNRWRRWGGWAVAAGLGLLPWILMQRLLAQSWVWHFAAIVSCSAVGLCVVIRSAGRAVAPPRAWLAFFGGAAAVGAVTVVLTLARGASPAGLLQGIVLAPLSHPGVYFFEFFWRPGSLAVSAGGLVLVGWAAWRPSLYADRVVAGVRGLAGLAYIGSALEIIPVGLAPFALSYGIALAGVCALPLRHDAAGLAEARVRQWLGLLFVLQSLHAFPVAGSQLNWGTFLWVPLLFLSILDAVRASPAAAPLLLQPRIHLGAAAVGFLLAAVMGSRLLWTGWQNRHQGQPLGLPGARAIVVPDNGVFALRIVAANARAHAGLLFTLPGMYSFNLWAERPTPTLANATHWFSLLSRDSQRAIAGQLHADPRAMVVIQRDLFYFLLNHSFKVEGLLARYIARDFEPVFAVDGYTVCVRRGRAIAKLLTGAWIEPTPHGAARRLELTVPALAAPIARVTLRVINSPNALPRATLSSQNASAATATLDATGQPLEALQPQPWPIEVTAPFTRLVLDCATETPSTEDLVAVAYDAGGRELTAVRILR